MGNLFLIPPFPDRCLLVPSYRIRYILLLLQLVLFCVAVLQGLAPEGAKFVPLFIQLMAPNGAI